MRALATISCLAAAAGAVLTGVFRTDSGCILLSLDPSTGANTTLASNLQSCASASNLFPAYSTTNGTALTVAIQSAPTLFTYDLASGHETAGAPLPSNGSDPFIGLVTVGTSQYLVTVNNIYVISGGTTKHYASVSLPDSAEVAAVPTAGTGGKGAIYIADGTSNALYIVDLGNSNGAVSKITQGVSRVWDLQYSSSLNVLVELASYQLYYVNPSNGAITQTPAPVVDGPGYPRVNGISTDGATFFFIDFAWAYTIDLKSGATLTKAAFTWAPRAVGYPVWNAYA